jgi:probable rRNA maturation factor
VQSALLFLFLELDRQRQLEMVILRKPVAALDESMLDRFLARARQAVRLRGEVTVLVTTSRELRSLNARFRGKDHATDVLSFPADVVGVNGYAGDVAISAEIAAQNARRLGHSAADEIKILTLHGVLHLAGFDHEQDRGQMARKEQRLRKQLGLPDGLIERSERLPGHITMSGGNAKRRKSAQGLRAAGTRHAGRAPARRSAS